LYVALCASSAPTSKLNEVMVQILKVYYCDKVLSFIIFIFHPLSLFPPHYSTLRIALQGSQASSLSPLPLAQFVQLYKPTCIDSNKQTLRLIMINYGSSIYLRHLHLHRCDYHSLSVAILRHELFDWDALPLLEFVVCGHVSSSTGEQSLGNVFLG